jgi:HTH-type transcriptional regulator, sugar sensing transcriptional regulator
MEIKKVLEQIGIEGKKSDVYLACLESGGATAYLIAKKVGLKRPTVYDIINQLMKDGLVYKSIKGKIKYFSPADPAMLLKKIKDKEENIKLILPLLQNLYNSPNTKPFVRYFEGKEGIREMYEDSLRSCKKGDEILAYVGEDFLVHFPSYVNDYVERRAEKGVVLRGIYKSNPEILKYMDKNDKQLRVAKVLAEKDFPVTNETNIYKNKVAIASYGREMFGMIIESEEIARSQKAIFELLWKNLPKQ